MTYLHKIAKIVWRFPVPIIKLYPIMAFSQPRNDMETRKLTLTHISDFTSFYVHFFFICAVVWYVFVL